MKKENYFKLFSSKHKILYFVLIVIPVLIISIISIFGIFSGSDFSFDMWINICIGLLTYIGSTILGIIVYYNSWAQQYKEEMLNFEITAFQKIGNEFFNFIPEKKITNEYRKYEYSLTYEEHVFPCDNYSFVNFDITNYNSKYPLNVEICKIEFNYNNSERIDCTQDAKIFTNFNLKEAIDYKIKCRAFIGIDDFYLKKLYEKEDVDIYYNSSIDIYLRFYNLTGYEKFLQLNVVCGYSFSPLFLNKKAFYKIVKPNLSLHESFIPEKLPRRRKK